MEGLEPDSKTLEKDGADLLSLNPFGEGFENARTVGSGGNVSCADIGLGDALSSGRVNYDDETGTFDAEWPQGFTVEVIDDYIVNWTFTPFEDEDGVLQCIGNLSVIVKGGNAPANVYDYESGATGGTGLIPPNNAGGQQAGLSNLTFCYTLEPCDEPCEENWEGETAWAAGHRYVARGNWATFTPYAEGSVDLLAGQTLKAGKVYFSSVVDGKVTITIKLNEGWRFQDGAKEAVKIQGYDYAPSGNPAPGRFTTYKGNKLEITVDAFDFYGIHLDVEELRGEICPE